LVNLHNIFVNNKIDIKNKQVSEIHKASMALSYIGIKDKRMYSKIQKAINKLRAKDTTKKINI